MKFVFILTISCFAVIQATNLEKVLNATEWEAFKTTFGKIYKTPLEEQHRMNIFLSKKIKINEHNRKYDHGLTSFRMGINKFSDMEHSEVVQQFTGLKNINETMGSKTESHIAKINYTLPDSVDWREKGAVTSVKNQGICGACWAFSAVGTIEGQHFLKSGELISLSAQNLIDCSYIVLNLGCMGGLPERAYIYLLLSGGIASEESYPYVGWAWPNCKYDPKQSAASIYGYVDIPVGDESALNDAIANIGPISIGIDASDNFLNYAGGILDDSTCSNEADQLNHGVLAVGYGSENGTDYYIVKNSWGADWGEQGYIRMARNKNNQCGVATLATYVKM